MWYEHGVRESDKNCNYCHKRGHWRRDCYAYQSRSKQNGMSVNPKPAMLSPQGCSPELQSYLPFITEGSVSLVGCNEKIQVKILRDTGAFDSFWHQPCHFQMSPIWVLTYQCLEWG